MHRPALFAGLYFLFLPVICVNSQELSIPGMIQRLFVYQPEYLLNLPDSSQLYYRSFYDPLFSKKSMTDSTDIQNAVITSHSLYAGWFSKLHRFRYFLTGSYNNSYIKYIENTQKYILENQRKEWNIASGFAYSKGHMTIGFGLGRHLPEYGKREHLYEIKDNFKNYITLGPWQFSAASKINLQNISARLSIHSGPAHSSLSNLVTRDGSSFRSFPITIVKRTIKAGIDIAAKPVVTSSTFEFTHLKNSDLLKVNNCMPQSVYINSYQLTHTGYAVLPFSDSLSWNLSGTIAGGWVASYNFIRNRYTFFKSDSLSVHNLIIGSGLKLPYAISMDINQILLHISSPEGFLKLSALSAWTVFKPLDYRYLNADMTYIETGTSVKRTFSTTRFEFEPRIYVSHIKTIMKFTYLHKDIIVLLPVYIDPVYTELFDSQILLLEPSLSVSLNIGRIQIKGTVDQKVPLLLNSDSHNSAGSNHSDTHNTNKKNSGGTTISLSAVLHVPGIRN